MKCPRCQAHTAPDDIFCPQCGVKLAQGMQAVAAASPAVLTHNMIRRMAAEHEYNRLSPLSALTGIFSKEDGNGIDLDSGILSAVLQPEKAFYLTVRRGSGVYQEILLTRNSACYRWTDRDSKIVIESEASPRSFIEHIYSVIAREITTNSGMDVILSREEIPVLKAVASLCGILSLIKVRGDFTTSGLLQQMLKSGSSLQEHLKELSKKGLVRLAGTDDLLIRLTDNGRAMVGVLEDYDAFYMLQVLTEGRDEFASVYLVLNNGGLYLLSNPLNGDEVVVRTLDGERLRSILNWMWVAGVPVK